MIALPNDSRVFVQLLASLSHCGTTAWLAIEKYILMYMLVIYIQKTHKVSVISIQLQSL